MTARRAFLTVSASLLVVSAARVSAGGTSDAEIEGAGYTGSASGSWACGPDARVRYAGLGAQARLHARDEDTEDDNRIGRGMSLLAGLAVEDRSYVVLSCSPTDGGTCVVPPHKAVGGGRIAGGYDWRAFGLTAGVVLAPYYDKSTDRDVSVLPVPDVALRFGPRDFAWGELGIGAYDVPTIIRPGIYAGMGGRPWRWLEISGHVGYHATFDGNARGRYDVSARFLVDRLRVGAGFATSPGIGRTEPEGRLTLGLSL